MMMSACSSSGGSVYDGGGSYEALFKATAMLCCGTQLLLD